MGALAAPRRRTVTGMLTVTGRRIAGSRCRRRAVAGVGRLLALVGRLAVAAGDRAVVLRRFVWRTAPLRGETWWRSLHPGIVTAVATRDQEAMDGCCLGAG